MWSDLIKDALTEFNRRKLDEDIKWVSLSGTEQEILTLIECMNEYRKRKKTGVTTDNMMTINCIVKKKKDRTRDMIGGPYDDTVVCIPK